MLDNSIKSIPQKIAGTVVDVEDTIEILHEHTKFHRSTFLGQIKNIISFLRLPYFIARGAAGYNDYSAYPKISLPTPNSPLADLSTVMAERRSTQNFVGNITLNELSTLLHNAISVNHYRRSEKAPHVQLAFRNYPSPGGLYPTEFYFIINEVEGVSPCVAHYDARNHCLYSLKKQDGHAFSKIEIQSGSKSMYAPLICVMTSVPQRVTAKYGGRGYRMALLEAGHASQNICLAAQGLSIGTLAYGAYYDDELAELLGIDGVTETVVAVMLIGRELV